MNWVLLSLFIFLSFTSLLIGFVFGVHFGSQMVKGRVKKVIARIFKRGHYTSHNDYLAEIGGTINDLFGDQHD